MEKGLARFILYQPLACMVVASLSELVIVRQEFHLLGHHRCGEELHAVLFFPLAGMQSSFDIDQLVLPKILAAGFG